MTSQEMVAESSWSGKEAKIYSATRQETLPWIVMLGVDGTGKSTVLDYLTGRSLFNVRGIQIFHRRPAVVYPRPVETSSIISHYGKPAHGPAKSVVKLVVMVLDWLFGYWMQIRKWRSQGYLVIADRHSLLDLLVDPLRYRYGGPRWLVEMLMPLTPQPELILLLDAPVEVLQARKSELTDGQAAHLREGYLQLSQTLPNFHVISASRPIEEVCAEVVDVIRSFLPPEHQPPTKTLLQITHK